MTIEKNKKAGTLIITVTGSLDSTTAPKLEADLNESFDGVTELIFDLKDLKYISSSGLRVLLSAMKIIKSKGSMTVTNVNEDIMEVFEITGFSEILTIK